ncbi:MAG: enoyl-CoA hydratase/isomerase family protein [Caulobacteraceae bacterium]|nr:MAG: enoyl-CoA hydratase/isomerase family protein [Caulobacteraceae bacterium]
MVLHVSRPSAAVVLLEMDQPPVNALGMAARGELAAALDDADADLAVRCIVLTGRGQAFCAGDDLIEAAGRGAGGLEAVHHFNGLMARVEAARVPVIAAINGFCLGGGLELALACDIRLSSPGAIFTASGVNVGLMASVKRLPRLIGEGPAKALLLSGAPVDAETALIRGLVTGLHRPVVKAALALADRIASRAPLSVEAVKRVVGRPFDERAELATLFHSEDHQAALAAFAAKRTPSFNRC